MTVGLDTAMGRAGFSPGTDRADRLAKQAGTQLEASFLSQLLKAGGGFSLGDQPGASLTEDMIIDTMATVVAEGGGLGLGKTIQDALAPDARPTSDLVHRLVASPDARQTSSFGRRTDPFTGQARFHGGIDIGAPLGAPVKSVTAGLVVRAAKHPQYGNLVEIQRADGSKLRYAHLSRVQVRAGQRIDAGQVIGNVGKTGRATGPHLHFEVRVDARATDPTQALKTRAFRADSSGERRTPPPAGGGS